MLFGILHFHNLLHFLAQLLKREGIVFSIMRPIHDLREKVRYITIPKIAIATNIYVAKSLKRILKMKLALLIFSKMKQGLSFSKSKWVYLR